jgi:cytochrome b561
MSTGAGAGMEVDGAPVAPDDGAQRREVGHYRLPAQLFHWATAVLVLLLVSSGVIARQLNDGPVADLLFSLHKLTGALTLMVILSRLGYRLSQRNPDGRMRSDSRPVVHRILYVAVILVPLLGWAGISDFGSREIFPGYSLPPIWPEGAGFADLFLTLHAYFAFGLLALVALHIGVAMQDYMTRARADAPRDDD